MFRNMKKAKISFNLMVIVLIVIGIIQFFEVSKLVNFILGIIAIIFGTIDYIIKHKKITKSMK